MAIENLTERQVATTLGVSISTLQKWRWQRRGPKYFKLEGHAVRYPATDLAEYIATCRSGPRRGGKPMTAPPTPWPARGVLDGVREGGIDLSECQSEESICTLVAGAVRRGAAAGRVSKPSR